MARNSSNSLWYVPLFAGTEATKARNLNYDANQFLAGQLPGTPPWAAFPGLSWWWDAAAGGTLHGGDPIGRVDDRSEIGTHGTPLPGIPGPRVDATGPLLPRTLNFEA